MSRMPAHLFHTMPLFVVSSEFVSTDPVSYETPWDPAAAPDKIVHIGYDPPLLTFVQRAVDIFRPHVHQALGIGEPKLLDRVLLVERGTRQQGRWLAAVE